jgi:hypothetical protein
VRRAGARHEEINPERTEMLTRILNVYRQSPEGKLWGRESETFSATAASDLSSKRGYSVTLTASNPDKVDVAVSGGRILGALINNPAQGQAAMVALEGSIVEMICDGSGQAITAFALVGPDANGRMIVKVAGSVDIVGHALDAVSTLGGVARVLIRCAR